MSETWAKQPGDDQRPGAAASGPAEPGGLDLHLDLSGTRVRAGLESAMRGAIRAGRLRPGTRLPPSRALAADLGIARNTVAEVYSQLVAEGWLTAQTGSGTSVAPRRAAEPGGAVAARPEVAIPRYDLRAGVPDLAAFPRRAWLAAARKVLADTPDHLLGYPDPRGLPQLRAALADYLARVRGVIADPAHIVICAGFTHGLAGISRALRSAGASTLAVEAYGHRVHRDIAAAQGLRLRPLPVDGMGAVIGQAAEADAVLLTPAHQFPLGVTLHPRRRREVADWGGVVIEDDYDGEFRYDRQPVGALQTLAPDHVIYAGTASKSLAPSLRLGWLVVPPRLLDAVTAGLAAGPSALDQLTLAEFITSGGYDRQIRRARLAYRRRRDRLAAALRRQGLQVTGIAAGLHAVLEFSRTDVERAVVARASEHGLAIEGLEHFRAGAGPPASGGRAGLVIGYGRPSEHAYTTALARLCAVLPSGTEVLTGSLPARAGRGPGRWEERAWSFGPDEDEEYGGSPGYGRPPGYGPPERPIRRSARAGRARVRRGRE
jgi:GntR family transcriptional regulator / MocR family aminotransferase